MDPIIIAALILTAVAKGDDNSAPEGLLYAGLMANVSLDEFQAVIGALEQSGLVTRSGAHVIRLTAEGIGKAAEIEERIA